MAAQKEPSAAGFLILGGLILVAVWNFWPHEVEPSVVTVGAYTFAFVGGSLVLNGLMRGRAASRIRREREAALQPSGVFGEAAFATVDECKAMTNPAGLFLGLLDGVPLFHNGKAHLLTVAPARQGKGVSVVVPNLLHNQGSVFVTDPKGELAVMTVGHRKERFGQKVIVINPWGLHGLPKDRFNPLQVLLDDAGDAQRRRDILDDARAIALQLLPEPEEDSKNRYFREGARKLLVALMLHFATRDRPEACTLVEVWRTIQNIGRLRTTVIEMAASTALNGVVADMAQDLSHVMSDKNGSFQDFREGAAQAVSIFDPVSDLGVSVSGSDFRFEELKTGRVSIYLVIPQERIATHGQWLGLLTRQAITAVTRVRTNDPVLFLLDEFANMGRLAGLAESLTGLPGLGVRVWAIVQELSDLRRVYGRDMTDTILSQAETQQFFAVQNAELASQLSRHLGTKTVKTMNYNLGRGDDEEIAPSIGEAGRPLMTADEIRLLPSSRQLILYRNTPPILCDRVAYWEVEPWRQWAAVNPIEGKAPTQPVRLTLTYAPKGQGRGKGGG